MKKTIKFSEYVAQKSERQVGQERNIGKNDTRHSLQWDFPKKIMQNRPKTNNVNYRRAVLNIAACLLIVAGAVTLKNLNTDELEKNIVATMASEYAADEDFGRLQLVNGNTIIPSSEVFSGSIFSLPMAGKVTETFSETGKYAVITGQTDAPVMAILPGTVTMTDKGTVIVENDNGTQTTYMGVTPAVKAGSHLISGQYIGQLTGENLRLTTASGVGYIDSLNEVELVVDKQYE